MLLFYTCQNVPFSLSLIPLLHPAWGVTPHAGGLGVTNMSSKEVTPEMGTLESKLVQTVQKLVQLSRKVDEIKTICFEDITALDDHDSKRPRVECFIGERLSETRFSKIYKMIQKIVDFYYRVESKEERNINVRDVAIVIENDEVKIMIQLAEDVYNEYGTFIGTERWYITLDELLQNVEGIVNKYETVVKNVEKVLETIDRMQYEE